MSDTLVKRNWWLIAELLWTALAVIYLTLVPVGNDTLLYPLLLSFVALAGAKIVRRRIRPHPALILPAVLWAAFLALGIITALTRGAESWPRVLVFFLIWPVLFSVIVVGFDRRVVRTILGTGAWMTVVMGVLLFIQALAAGGLLPFRKMPSWIGDPLRMAGGSDHGMISLTATIMPPLLWWGGIWIASLFCDPQDRYLPPIWLRSLAGTLVIAGALVSWRRGIVIVLVITPVLAVVVLIAMKVRSGAWSDEPRFRARGFLLLALVAVVGVGLSLTVQAHLTSMFRTTVASTRTVVEKQPAATTPSPILKKPPAMMSTTESNDLGDEIRQTESRTMLTPHSVADWAVGRGLGASIDRGGMVRPTEAWKTELQYHAIFYWTGLLGTLLLVATSLAAFRAVRKAFRTDDALRGALYATTVGALCLLIANASNPYLQVPGNMWALFLPLMIANAILTRQIPRTRQVSPVASAEYAP